MERTSSSASSCSAKRCMRIPGGSPSTVADPDLIVAMPLSIALSITACMLDSMDQDEKVRENRLRRMAERQGFRLTKTRRMDPLATDYGTWHLIPAKGKPLGPFSIDERSEERRVGKERRSRWSP